MITELLGTAAFEKTLKEYEYTRRAQREIRTVIESEAFEEMSPEEIFRTLYQHMQTVSFANYLKRYLYERAFADSMAFDQVSEDMYQELIQNAFEENLAPHSFQPTTTRWNATVRSWLRSERVRRETVFLLGFGLKMSAGEVSEFLMKVLMEDDFRAEDPEELIYQYCFSYQQPYAAARKWLDRYEGLTERSAAEITPGRGEEALLRRLLQLKASDGTRERAEKTRACFDRLLTACREAVLKIYQEEEAEKPENRRRTWRLEDIACGDLEQMLCSGIPRTASGNLTRASQSHLCRQFQSYRPSRQRLELIRNGKQLPDRYDLITLMFFISAQEDLPGRERLVRFLGRCDGMLEELHMGRIYAANPYEAFILICVLSECPLSVYGDIWELSYADGTPEQV